MKKKIFLTFLAIITLAFIYFCFNPFTYNINKSIEGIIVNNKDSKVLKKTKIILDGEYSFNLFKTDTFSGRIKIKGSDIDYPIDEISFENGEDVLIYRSYSGSKLNSKILGLIYADPFMENVSIIYSKDSKEAPIDYDDYDIFITNSNNRKEAIADLYDLVKESNDFYSSIVNSIKK